MIGQRTRTLTALLGCAFVLLPPTLASAANLSGQEGDVRRKVMYMNNVSGGCASIFKRYIAASGHSAFAATTIHYWVGPGHVCGISINAGSQKAAEQRAMASCQAALKKYKGAGEQKMVGPCYVHMSK